MASPIIYAISAAASVLAMGMGILYSKARSRIRRKYKDDLAQLEDTNNANPVLTRQISGSLTSFFIFTALQERMRSRATLESLTLDGGNLGHTFFKYFRSLKGSSLRRNDYTLRIKNNYLSDCGEHLANLISTPHLRQIKTLDLRESILNQNDVEKIINALKQNFYFINTKEILIDDRYLNDEQRQALTHELAINKEIHEESGEASAFSTKLLPFDPASSQRKPSTLNLEKLTLSDMQGYALARCISLNFPYLKNIKITEHAFSPDAIEAITLALQKNTHITKLTFNYRGATKEQEDRIKRHLMINQGYKMLKKTGGQRPRGSYLVGLGNPFLSLPVVLVTIGLWIGWWVGKWTGIWNRQLRNHIKWLKEDNNYESDLAKSRLKAGAECAESGRSLSNLNPRAYTPLATLGYVLQNSGKNLDYDQSFLEKEKPSTRPSNS